ncbi:hypothetical protein Esti_002155 [Eimeria stiedai]
MDILGRGSASSEGPGRREEGAPAASARLGGSLRFSGSGMAADPRSSFFADSSGTRSGVAISLSRQSSRAADNVRAKSSDLSTPPGVSASPSLRLSKSRSALSGEMQDRGSSRFSYAHLQAAGGPQGTLGREPDYWTYTAPPMTSAANRVFAQSLKHEESRDLSETPRNDHLDAYKKSGNIDRLLGTDEGAGRDRGGPMQARSVNPSHSAHAYIGDPIEDEDEQQGPADWQEPHEEEEGQEPVYEGIGEAIWKKKASRASTYNPICMRTARERCAYTTSDDWAIFALHSQYVRPLRDRDWVPGEPCITRKGRYSESSSGLPATAFESFVFPNPPRQFLMSSKGTLGVVGSGQPFVCYRTGRGKQADRRRPPQLTQQQLLDLERMLWFDPEPRLERPFRLYADSKGCLKARFFTLSFRNCMQVIMSNLFGFLEVELRQCTSHFD